MWQSRSRFIFRSSVLIAGVVLFQMTMYALHVLFGIRIGFNVLNVCTEWMRSKGIFSIAHLLDAFVIGTFVYSMWQILRQFVLSRRIFAKLDAYRHTKLSAELNRMYPEARGNIVVVVSDEPIALTMGFGKPAVVLSTGLLDMLEASEAEAVIHHELHHQQTGDPRSMFFLSLLASVLWYLPVLKWFHHQYKIAREILADNYAISRQGSSRDLGSALLKLLRRGGTVAMPFAYASFADTSINYRIRRIVDPESPISFRPPLTPTMISGYVLVVMTWLFVQILF
ncbi:M56 family metallopeptidase [Paenibacillus chitinolyticus]|uniref:M56 family metallopeptidase n=1 Tax=Paenibacillus chitinolyticus TaxID=79263 RepID=UPI00365F29E4